MATLAERRASVLQRPAPRDAGGLRQGLPMAFPVRCCALVGRFEDPRIAESVSALLPHLASRGVRVLVSEDAALAAGVAGVVRVAGRELGERADLIIAIGGGRALRCAPRLAARPPVPPVRVNRGGLRVLPPAQPPRMAPPGGPAPAREAQPDE